MEKLKMHSANLTRENTARIREIFPNCVTETRDEQGNLTLAVDFDLLRQELADSIVEGPQERYHLDWPGKREALLAANAPIAKTLRPCREESVDFDTTQNLFIEGDNLDALKLLQENYLGKVKMIYIDPPYNTGNDFIYKDDFAENVGEYMVRSNQKDEQGNRLMANTEANGRFHSDWLSMMYPRLKLAKNLLREDGVIFISIDDNEQKNLIMLCNAIFGEDNYFASIVLKNKAGAGAKPTGFISVHEYILCYVKNRSVISSVSTPMSATQKKLYNKVDEKYNTRGPYGTWALSTTSMDDRPNLRFQITHAGEEIWPEKQWLWSKERVQEALDNNELVFNKKNDGCWSVRFKRYLYDEDGVSSLATPTTFWDGPYTHAGTKEMIDLFHDRLFSFPKPSELVKQLLSLEFHTLVDESNCIILDFFAGSATTAHAVMQLNAEDGGSRRFILVQLPEPCDEKSEAYKAGYKSIAEVSKERIRRAGKKIKAKGGETPVEMGKDENQEDLFPSFDSSSSSSDSSFDHQLSALDTGFRVLKVDTSNMEDVYYSPDALRQEQLEVLIDNVKPDRTPEDLLFQVMLDWGVELTLPIRKESIHGQVVFFVDENALVACFDPHITEELIRELAKYKPIRVVFRDNGFASDDVKINAEQIFKQLSPSTEVKTI
jgi:adenine-specific DNA-methyltransferase